MYSFCDLKKCFKNAKFYNFNNFKLNINKVEHDSRKNLKDSIYIAIKGDNFDGHDFVWEAFNKGSKVAVVEKYVKSNVPQILVTNTINAYLKLANYNRCRLNATVIAITGSNGKTTSKDLIYSILSPHYSTYKNFGNQNNLIGLPYTLANVKMDAEFVVLEMGMNKLGEIKKLAKCAKPNIGLITNIGTAHIGKLKSLKNIIKAKLELFDYLNAHNGLIIFNSKDKNLYSYKNYYQNKINFINIKKIENNNNLINKFVFKYKGTCFKTYTKLKGDHNLSNISGAITLGLKLGISPNNIVKEIKKFTTSDMRFEIIEKNNVKYIVDCYNANLESMKAIISFVSSQNVKGNKIAVVGDMNELGKYSKKFHEEIGKFMKISNIDKVFSIGNKSNYYKNGFSDDKNFTFLDMNNLILLKNQITKGDLVFFKASRSIGLEKVYAEVSR